MKLTDWMQGWQGEFTFGILSLVTGILLVWQDDGYVAIPFFVLAVGSLVGAWTKWRKVRDATPTRQP